MDGHWKRIRAVARRHALSQSRNPGYWFLLIMLPVVDGLLFGSIGVAQQNGHKPVTTLVLGIMLFHVVWQLALAGSLGLLEEVWSRNLLNLIATPLTSGEFLAAITLVGLARTTIAVGLVSAVGAIAFTVVPATAGWVLLPSVAILLVFGLAVTLTVTGLTLQFGDSAEVFSWGLLVLLMPLSGVFYPIGALPGPLQPVARAIPLTQVFEAAREAVDHGGIPWSRLALGAAGSLVALAVAAAFLHRQVGRFRRLGWVTRFS